VGERLLPREVLRRGREERDELPVVPAGPDVERVVVALGAADVRAQEHRRGRLDQRQLVARIAEVERDGRVVPQAALGQQQLAGRTVVRHVLPDRVLDPPQVQVAAAAVVQVGLGPQGVGPVVEHRADVPLGPDQASISFARRCGSADLRNRSASCGDGIRPAKCRYVRRRNVSSSAPGFGFWPTSFSFDSTSSSIRRAVASTSTGCFGAGW
jgi:hypothetical protein